jgi:hypothetical protein
LDARDKCQIFDNAKPSNNGTTELKSHDSD